MSKKGGERNMDDTADRKKETDFGLSDDCGGDRIDGDCINPVL